MEGGRVLTIHSFSQYLTKLIVTFLFREAQEDSDEDEEDGGSAEENKEEEVKESPKQPEETEFQRRQKELIQKQMQAQNEMITQKKEEAKAATEAAVIADTGDKVNVLDIKVEDNFDIDDI